MQYLGIDYGTPRLPELDAAFIPMGAWMRAYETQATKPVCIAVETANGRIVTRDTALIADGAHVEELDESTIDANARFFEKRSDVPTKAISMGMGDILRAKKLLLLATGENKVEAMKGLLLNEELDVQNPATLVKTHPDLTVIIDRALADRVGYRG